MDATEELVHERGEGLLHRLLVAFAVGFEPGLVVVLLEVAKERQVLARELSHGVDSTTACGPPALRSAAARLGEGRSIG
jgi:hypothetical protein